MSQSLPAGGMASWLNRPKTWVPALEAASGIVLVVLLAGAALLLRWIALLPRIAPISPYLLVFVTLALAYGLYAIRLKRPMAYGTAEVSIGVLVVWFAPSQTATVFKEDARFGRLWQRCPQASTSL